MPRLAAQREDYLPKALRDYKSAKRPGYDATMDEVIRPITDAESSTCRIISRGCADYALRLDFHANTGCSRSATRVVPPGEHFADLVDQRGGRCMDGAAVDTQAHHAASLSGLLSNSIASSRAMSARAMRRIEATSAGSSRSGG